MTPPLLQAILTIVLDKRNKGLVRNIDDGILSVEGETENYIIYNPMYKDFYFIADHGTLPKRLDDSCVIGGVEITIYHDLVRLKRKYS